jgi:hypothetical protein
MKKQKFKVIVYHRIPGTSGKTEPTFAGKKPVLFTEMEYKEIETNLSWSEAKELAKINRNYKIVPQTKELPKVEHVMVEEPVEKPAEPSTETVNEQK